MRGAGITLVLLAGVFLSATIRHEPPERLLTAPRADPLAPARLHVSYAPQGVSITGTSASPEHEATLARQAADLFGASAVSLELTPGVIVSREWVVAGSRLLQVVDSMESAEAELTDGTSVIRGVTSQADTTAARVDELRSALPHDIELHADIIVVTSSASLDELCRKAFASTVLEPVAFEQSSAVIRDSSLATLDRITGFLRDCPGVSVAITGHTDSSGDESRNQALSRARAQAVADHIAHAGIDARRLIVAGAGSSQPIADNTTRYGRELNRRIEFDLR